jgi:hypothetical protein
MQTSGDRRLQLVPVAIRAGVFYVPALFAVACLAFSATSLSAQELTVQALTTQGPASFATLPDAPQPQTPVQPNPQQHITQPATPGTLCHISGVVSDIQGGLIPGAHVLAERAGAPASESQEVIASNLGHFRFSDLAAGSYTVTITSPGFETYRLQDIILKPGEAYELPEVALPIARTSADATVTITEQQLAEAELNDELHQRVLGILPNYYTSYIWDAAPLTMRQKFKLSIRSATDPVFFASTALTAGIQYANNSDPEYGPGVGGYFTRYAADYGDALVGRIVTSVLLNSLFKEDPRYFVMTNGSIPRRAFHAVMSTVTQRGDDKHWHPAYANFIGSASAALITSTWHQGSSTVLGNQVLGATFYDLGGEAIRNLAREFLFRHLARHIPTYAKGKPPDEKPAPASPLPNPSPSR